MTYFLKHNLIIMATIFLLVGSVLYFVFISQNESNISFFLEGMFLLDDVLIYITCLEVLKRALMDQEKLQWLTYKKQEYSYFQTRVLSFVCAFPFGLGVSSFLKSLSKTEINTKPISEGMTSSMLIYPTTLASGFVFDYFKLTSISNLFILSLPLCLFIIFPIKHFSLKTLLYSKLFWCVLFLSIVNYIYLIILSIYIEHYFMIKQSAFFIILALIINTKTLAKLHSILYNARLQLIFFMCLGIMGHAFIQLLDNNEIWENLEWSLSIYIIMVPIFIIPILSIFFIHPLVLFIIFSPIISPIIIAQGIGNYELYLVWIVMLINSQLLSPVSLTTVLAVTNSNSNIFSESFLKHIKFSIKLSIASFVYLLWLYAK